MNMLWKCIFSPRLLKIYDDPDDLYQQRGIEKYADKIITGTKTIARYAIYGSPFIFMFLYKRGFLSWDETKMVCKMFTTFGCILITTLVVRALGRTQNPKYMEFMKTINAPMDDKNEYIKNIRKYDYDFRLWPVSFAVTPLKSKEPWHPRQIFETTVNSDLPAYQRIPIQILGYIAAHTFGVRLVYPGSLGLIQNLLNSALVTGRGKIIEENYGQRAKLATADGNFIDTLFVDKRRRSSRGGVLVICCEGNSGFYEIGIMGTPIDAGFSALGWNHPGFGHSTGMPYPSQEKCAIEAVVQYTVNVLRFHPDNVVLFGWSIGGYSATWALVKYALRGLILDASFDDLLPLAQSQMPRSWSLLVKEVIRGYLDLNIAQLLELYDGPLQIIRRTDDEIICLRPGYIETNRANDLVMKVIKHRHPGLLSEPNDEKSLWQFLVLTERQRGEIDLLRITRKERQLLEVITRYMWDHNSTHCMPLPEAHFDVIIDSVLNY